MLVYIRPRNALDAPCALCARRWCAVTTLCTPLARHERSVTTQNSEGARWHAVGAPRKRHCRRGRAVTSPCYGKCEIIHYISYIFVRSHGALRSFKSPCQRRGIAVECDRALINIGTDFCCQLSVATHPNMELPRFGVMGKPKTYLTKRKRALKVKALGISSVDIFVNSRC